MKKYIDAERLRTEIERRFSEYNHDANHHVQAAECASILDFLDSLQQEQMVLPDNLDEAAYDYNKKHSKIVERYDICHGDYTEELYDVSAGEAFEAGAEWMAEQMKRVETPKGMYKTE